MKNLKDRVGKELQRRAKLFGHISYTDEEITDIANSWKETSEYVLHQCLLGNNRLEHNIRMDNYA